MAFDQNSVPQNLRPLNIVRNAVEDPRIAPVSASGRPIEGFYGNPPRDGVSPNSIPAVYYPAETGLVSLGFTTNAAVPVPGVAGWVPRLAPSPPSGIVATPTPTSVVNSGGGSSHNAAFGARLPGTSASDQVTDENTEDSVSGRKVKFMCSFGGKILPRPSDGALRYVGGQTRIISVRKDLNYGELVQKMVDTYGQNVVIKYQLPEEDLDALVSVSCPDDLENMMDEYDKLLERSPDGSAKLRVFLFSASEVDSAGMVPIADWHDGGQKYVEAVNGYIDGSGSARGVISRKESTASSTHSSDANGTEILDSSGRSHGEIIGPNSTSVPSPSENFTASQEAVKPMMVVDPSHVIQFDASTSPVAVSNSGHPPLSAQCENELEIPLSVGGQQQQVDPELTQTARTVPATSPYLQPYIDPRQDTIPRGDYVQSPAQLGFPTQLLGHVAPMFPQTHITSGASHQQFIPAVHMTMVPSSHVSMNPNLVQPQQIRLDPYSPESSLGQRVIHVPADQGYKPYHAPLPHAVLGGAYSWHQVPPTEQVTFSEGYAPHQQAMAAEKIARFDDCLMCQKALPHAHSDTVAQDQRESPASTISDSRSIYHSLRLDDIGRPINRAFVPGVLGEPMVEKAATGLQSRVLGNLNYGVGILQSDNNGLQQNAEGHYEKDRVILQKAPENSEFSKLPVQQGIGVTGGIPSSYGVFVGNFPQSSRDNVVQPVLNPTHYQVKQDAMMNKPTISDIPAFAGTALQPSDHLVDESPKDSSDNTPTTVPLEDNIKSYAVHEHLRQIDGRMENLWVSPSEILTNTEQNKPPIDISKGEDILENKQHVGGETYSNESSYMHNLQAAESFEVAQSPLVNPGAYNTHSKFGVNLVADDTSYNTGFSGVDSMHTTERVAPIGEKWDNAPRVQPNIVSTGVEAFLLDGNTSSVSPSYRIGDIHDSSNSLFSNQDPWNLRHDSHFPPPRPSKIQIKKEPTKDLSGDNRLERNGDLLTGNNMGLVAEIQLDNGVNQAFCNLNTDSSLEHPETNNG